MQLRKITTYAAGRKAVTEETVIPVTLEADEARHPESGVVNLRPGIEYQTFEGFGGAMTETAAYLLSQMDGETQDAALRLYFGPGSHGLRFIRVHMDSCDYSLEEYQAVEDPIADPELSTFSLKRDKLYILPMLKKAMALSEHPLSVLLSPWSPPACWKTPPERPKNDASAYGGPPGMRQEIDYDHPSRCNGGRLKPEYYGSWAKYMIKFVKAYLDEGIPVTMLSVQNESIAATGWDSCVWSPEQEKTFLRDYLYPELKAAGLEKQVGLYFWDHNKERMYERALYMLDEDTRDMIEGIAFHWYSGDHFEDLALTAQTFPEKKLILSECCRASFAGFGGGFMSSVKKSLSAIEYENAVAYAHDIIGNLNAGMHRWIDWNLMVDPTGGPRHVKTFGFTATVIANPDGTFTPNLSYAYVRHFAAYIKPGAKRVAFSRCDDKAEFAALKNPDGAVVLVALNPGDDDHEYILRFDEQIARVPLPARTISTLILE